MFRQNGQHGPGGLGDNIWSSMGHFGTSYGDYSPWNSTASDPPVIVDAQGKYYGRFVVLSRHSSFGHSERTKVPELVRVLAAIAAAKR